MHKLAMEVKVLEDITKEALEALVLATLSEELEEASIFAAAAKILSKSDLPQRINNLLMLADSARTAQRSDEETERAAFEKRWKHYNIVNDDYCHLTRDRNGLYEGMRTQAAWSAWQLRAETFNLSK